MLSDQATLLLEQLAEAHEEAAAIHTPEIAYRDMGLFTKMLVIRLAHHKHIEVQPGDGEPPLYRITEKGLKALKERRNPTPKVKGKPGRPRANSTAVPDDEPLIPGQKLASKVRSFSQQVNGTFHAKPAPQPPADAALSRVAAAALESKDVSWEKPDAPLYHAASEDYVPPSHTPVAEKEPLPDLSLHAGDGCKDCVYEQAIEILSRKLPGVHDLVAALKQIDRIQTR